MGYARTRTRSASSGTGHWMDLRFKGTCSTGGEELPAGARAFYDPRDRTVTCTNLDHAEQAGLVREAWVGSPISGGLEKHLADTRLSSFVGEPPARRPRYGARTTYRCTHEDYPCCGC